MKNLRISVNFAQFIKGDAFNVDGVEKDFVFRLEEMPGRNLVVARFLLNTEGTAYHCNIEKLSKTGAECYTLAAFNIIVRFKLVFSNGQTSN